MIDPQDRPNNLKKQDENSSIIDKNFQIKFWGTLGKTIAEFFFVEGSNKTCE
jgi:hypothetical protein